jgi:hypothetical protein
MCLTILIILTTADTWLNTNPLALEDQARLLQQGGPCVTRAETIKINLNAMETTKIGSIPAPLEVFKTQVPMDAKG